MPSRELWVDYAKAIGILLVVYGHVARGMYSAGLQYDSKVHFAVDSVIYSFHMPLFFFLSGLFFLAALQRRGVRGIVLDKAKTLIYPLVVWSLLQGGVEVLLSNYTNNNTSIGQVLSFLWAPRAQFWFLHALFFVSVIAAATYSACNKKYQLLLFLIFCLVYLFRHSVTEVRVVDAVLRNLVFFSFGILFYEHKKLIEENLSRFVLVSVPGFFCLQFFFHFGMESDYLVLHEPASLMLALVSILFVACFSISLSRRKISLLAKIGESSLDIFLIHVLVASGVRIVLQRILAIENVPIHLILGVGAGVVVPLVVKRLAPTVVSALSTPPVLKTNPKAWFS